MTPTAAGSSESSGRAKRGCATSEDASRAYVIGGACYASTRRRRSTSRERSWKAPFRPIRPDRASRLCGVSGIGQLTQPSFQQALESEPLKRLSIVPNSA